MNEKPSENEQPEQVTLGENNLEYDAQKSVLKIITTLETYSWYKLKIFGGITDLNGDQMGEAYIAEFRTGSIFDGLVPQVDSTNLPQDGTAVSVGFPFIEIKFKKAMDPTTIMTKAAGSSTSPIYVSSSAVTGLTEYIPGKVWYNAMNNSAEFRPDTAFEANTTYTVTVTTLVKSIAGVPLGTDQTFTFTAGAADDTKPVLNGAYIDIVQNTAGTNDLSAKGYLYYSESMKETEVENYQNYTLVTGTDIQNLTTTVDLSGALFEYSPEYNSVEISGLTLTPGHFFKLTVISNNVHDLSGNPVDDNPDTMTYPRSQDETNNNLNEWEGFIYNPFQYMDPLEIHEHYPNYDQTIPLNSVMNVRFNKPILESSIDSDNATVSQRNVLLYQIVAMGGATTGDALAGTPTLSDDGNTIFFDPDSDLVADNMYRFIVGNQDTSYTIEANDGTNINYAFTIDFTAGAVDDQPPKATWAEPKPRTKNPSPSIDDQLYVNPDASNTIDVGQPYFYIGFNEDLNPNTVNNNSVTLFDANNTSTQIQTEVYYDNYDGAIVVNPYEGLTANSSYIIQISNTVKDSQGIALVEDIQLTYQTIAEASTEVPRIIGGFADNGGLGIKFNKALNYNQVTNKDNYEIKVSAAAITDTTPSVSLQNVAIEYYSLDKSVYISGLNLSNNAYVQVTISNVPELSVTPFLTVNV